MTPLESASNQMSQNDIELKEFLTEVQDLKKELDKKNLIDRIWNIFDRSISCVINTVIGGIKRSIKFSKDNATILVPIIFILFMSSVIFFNR